MKNRRIGAVVVCLAVALVLAWPPIVHAESQKIRVVVEDASIRSEPDAASRIIESPPVGSVYEVQGKVGEWYEIEFTSKVGVLVTGYIHEMFVEVEKEVSKAPRTAKRRAFSLALSFGKPVPAGHMAEQSGDNALFCRSGGLRCATAVEYSLSPTFGAGLHYKIVRFPQSGWRDAHLGLGMIGAHGRLTLGRHGDARPYVLVGLGKVVMVDEARLYLFSGGEWYKIHSLYGDEPYVSCGGGLDYSVSSRVSLFAGLTMDFLFWRGVFVSGVDMQGGEMRGWELDQEYFFLDFAVGMSIRL